MKKIITAVWDGRAMVTTKEMILLHLLWPISMFSIHRWVGYLALIIAAVNVLYFIIEGLEFLEFRDLLTAKFNLDLEEEEGEDSANG